jgi:hypothetical protein
MPHHSQISAVGTAGRGTESLGDQTGTVGVVTQELDPLRHTSGLRVRQPFEFNHKPLKRFGVHVSPRECLYPESSLSATILNKAQ